VRWGTEEGTAVVDGGKIQVARPRVRQQARKNSVGGEVQLATYKSMNGQELLSEPMLARILAGVSTRRYASTIERSLRARGVSKSSVSRQAIAATKPTVDQFLERQVGELEPLVLLFDGISLGGRQMIVSIGINARGRKHVLGVRLGATENEVVCRDLIRDLIERGLSPEEKYLFVIDGSKALVKAIRAAFGQDTAIQRCQEHKIRDIQSYLPVKSRRAIRAKLQAAYQQRTEKSAGAKLERIRMELLRLGGEKAANALIEGLPETLTVHRLGVTGLLRKSLRTTNILESAFSAARRYLGRVSRYRNEAQTDRWAIRSLLEAERHFRTVAGNRQLADLKKALLTYKR
jgi:transposase-like protein